MVIFITEGSFVQNVNKVGEQLSAGPLVPVDDAAAPKIRPGLRAALIGGQNPSFDEVLSDI